MYTYIFIYLYIYMKNALGWANLPSHFDPLNPDDDDDDV
jgi:hypothetical protein